MDKDKLQMTGPIVVERAGSNCMQVELFLRVRGRLPDREGDIIDKALAEQYLDMWVNKELDKYNDTTHVYAFQVYAEGLK